MARMPMNTKSDPKNKDSKKGSLHPKRRKKILKEDVNDFKRIDKELRESEERFRIVYEASPIGIQIYDPQGRLVQANKACLNIYGISNFEEVKGFKLFDDPHIPAKEKKRLREGKTVRFQVLFDFRRVKQENLYNTTKSGTVYLDLIFSPICANGEGPVSGYLAQVQDFNKRKWFDESLGSSGDEMQKSVVEKTKDFAKANEELRIEIEERRRTEQKYRKARAEAEAASEAKSEFLANMSHEFRLPMNHIIGFTELLLSKKFGGLNKVQEEYLKDVLQSSSHLLSMLSDILDLAQVDSGKVKLDLSETNLESLFETCITAFKERAKKKGVGLFMDLDGLSESAYVDRHKLRRIVHNLLSNAIKFTPKGGKVNIKARMVNCAVRSGRRHEDSNRLRIFENIDFANNASDGNRVPCFECSVSDTGIGIRTEDKRRIFNTFEQLDGSSEKRYQGTGLGLSLTKKFVEMHGGKIFVESEGESKGSIFRFIIPIVD